jgi:hypothetical protein
MVDFVKYQLISPVRIISNLSKNIIVIINRFSFLGQLRICWKLTWALALLFPELEIVLTFSGANQMKQDLKGFDIDLFKAFDKVNYTRPIQFFLGSMEENSQLNWLTF